MQQINIVEVSLDEKFILSQLIELYEYDFSEFNDRDVNPFGRYGYKYLDHYWTDEGRHPYFIIVNEQYAGFVLINTYCYLQTSADAKAVAEFLLCVNIEEKESVKSLPNVSSIDFLEIGKCFSTGTMSHPRYFGAR